MAWAWARREGCRLSSSEALAEAAHPAVEGGGRDGTLLAAGSRGRSLCLHTRGGRRGGPPTRVGDWTGGVDESLRGPIRVESGGSRPREGAQVHPSLLRWGTLHVGDQRHPVLFRRQDGPRA